MRNALKWYVRATVLAVLACAPPALAQDAGPEPDTRQARIRAEREAKRERLEPYVVTDGEQRVRGLERVQFPRNIFVDGYRGFRPLIGGMPSGSGFVVGGGYRAGDITAPLGIAANARVSSYGYTTFDARLTFPPKRGDLPIQGFVGAEVRDLKALNFFGLGPTTGSADPATYRLEDRSITAGAVADLSPDIAVGAEARLLRADVSPGTRRTPLDQRFEASSVPGFGFETDYYRYGGHLEVDLRDQELPAAGLWARVDVQRYENRDGAPLDFDRVVADVHGYVPLGPRSRMLALRFRTSHSTTQSGQRVPFYLMETLGGAGTLRGFREYRFRDARNMLINAEYRWEVWTHVDFALFYDAGKVFAQASEFDFQDLQSAYGFGVRAHAFGDTMVRIDVARSNEGIKLHIGAGPSF